MTSLDVSGLPALTTLNVNDNDLADIDLSQNTLLQTADFSNNSLNKLDTSNNLKLTTVTAPNNGIYEVKAASTVTQMALGQNKLEKLDASGYKALTDLDVNNNMLSSLILPAEGKIAKLNCSNNHLATLNLKKVLVTSPTTGNINLADQSVYANPETTAVNMAEYDENFNEDGIEGSVDNGTISNGILSFTLPTGVKDLGELSFADSPTYVSYDWNPTGVTGNTNLLSVTILPADLMNRLYNPNSGEHFYTKDINERDTLVKLGWQSEGIGWIAPNEESSKAGAPVFRLYNGNAGDHHYTTSANERDTLVTKGWKYEGIGWYSAEAAKADESNGTTTGGTDAHGISQVATIEVFREYNPNAKEAGAHNYTISENENDTLVSLGWLDEGIGWWALK